MNATHDLLGGRLSPAAARRLVRRSHARFVFADCRDRGDLRPALGALAEDVTRYGCATLYTIRGAP
jgi:hypothetical protein